VQWLLFCAGIAQLRNASAHVINVVFGRKVELVTKNSEHVDG